MAAKALIWGLPASERIAIFTLNANSAGTAAGGGAAGAAAMVSLAAEFTNSKLHLVRRVDEIRAMPPAAAGSGGSPPTQAGWLARALRLLAAPAPFPDGPATRELVLLVPFFAPGALGAAGFNRSAAGGALRHHLVNNVSIASHHRIKRALMSTTDVFPHTLPRRSHRCLSRGPPPAHLAHSGVRLRVCRVRADGLRRGLRHLAVREPGGQGRPGRGAADRRAPRRNGPRRRLLRPKGRGAAGDVVGGGGERRDADAGRGGEPKYQHPAQLVHDAHGARMQPRARSLPLCSLPSEAALSCHGLCLRHFVTSATFLSLSGFPRRWGPAQVTPPSGGQAITCTVRAPDSASMAFEASSAECDAESAAADSFPFADTVTIVLNATEDAVFQGRRAFFRGTDEQLLEGKSDMSLSVQFGRRRPVPATANFRGVSSFRDCKDRKSLAVDLNTKSGEGPRVLRRESGAGKFDLISLCADDGYVKTRTANMLAAAAGIYKLPTRLVRMQIRSPRGAPRAPPTRATRATRALAALALSTAAMIRNAVLMDRVRPKFIIANLFLLSYPPYPHPPYPPPTQAWRTWASTCLWRTPPGSSETASQRTPGPSSAGARTPTGPSTRRAFPM